MYNPNHNPTGSMTPTSPTSSLLARHRSPSPLSKPITKPTSPQTISTTTTTTTTTSFPSPPSSPSPTTTPSESEDSAYADSIVSSTTSITSSILDHYIEENGRRYYSNNERYENDYVLPIDEEELERLGLMHELWLEVGEGEVYRAPVRNPQRVLDLGTGTGLWSIHFADLHPSAHLLGLDLLPIQPTWIPPNLTFALDDIELPWQLPPSSYDYIHIRSLTGCISSWPDLLRQCYQHLAPGGYLEIQELNLVEPYSLDGTYRKDGGYGRWCELLKEGGRKWGKRMDVVGELMGWVRDAGFGDVRNEKEVLPVGRWPRDERYKRKGWWGLRNLDRAMEAYALAVFTRPLPKEDGMRGDEVDGEEEPEEQGGLGEGEVGRRRKGGLGMTESEARAVIEEGRRDLFDRKIHMCLNMHYMVARKPFEDELGWE